MLASFRTTRFVEFSDTDMAGIMHFSAFFRYMESAEHEFLRSLGMSIYAKGKGGLISYPRVAVSCEYHAPAKCEEVLEIEVAVQRVGTKSVTYGFAFQHDGQAIATGKITCVCCRIEEGTGPVAMPIPDDIANKLRALAAS